MVQRSLRARASGIQSGMPSTLHRLFFAVFPDAAARAAIERVVADLRATKRIGGRWTAASKYHVTLQFLGDHDDAAPLIAKASTAAQAVLAESFDFSFDRIATFRGRFQVPCVLRLAPDSEAAFEALWRQLGDALARAGIAGETQRRYQPHLTIAYADRMLAEPIAIEPISAPAREFALVDSPVGGDLHQVVGCWPLAADADDR